MERDELDALRSPRVAAAIAAELLQPATADPVARSTALRRDGLTPLESAAVLTQTALRRRARGKLGDVTDRMLLTRAGVEQATRRDVAAVHAARFREAAVSWIAELGCGIGGDTLAFAAAGLSVLAVERDAITAELARHNLAPFPRVRVVTGDAELVDLGDAQAVWLDPARRTPGHSGTRRVAPAASSPSPAFVDAVTDRLPGGVKRSPAADHADLPPGAEAQWVSSRGDVVELVTWHGALARPAVGRAALVLSGSGAAEMTGVAAAADEPVTGLGDHVHEPDGAVIRAGLLGDLARATGTGPVGPGIAYLTGSGPVHSPFLTSFRIEAVLPLDRGRIACELRARGVGRLEIKKRGVDLDPPRFRAALSLRGDEEATLIATRARDGRVALICRRVPVGSTD